MNRRVHDRTSPIVSHVLQVVLHTLQMRDVLVVDSDEQAARVGHFVSGRQHRDDKRE